MTLYFILKVFISNMTKIEDHLKQASQEVSM